MSSNIGQRIVDPRQLADELDDPNPDMYSNLAHYTFGTPRPTSLSPSDAGSDAAEPISPLALPRLSPDRTPRPSVSASPALFSVSSHPSQGTGRPASSQYHYASTSQSRRQSYMTDQSSSISMTSPVVSGSDSERSEDPSSSSDPIIAALYNSRRGRLMSDTASQHTFGRASHTHGFTAAASRDGVAPSSSSVSVTTSRSSSRASMRTTEQFSSDDELEFDDYYDDSNSSPVTFARYDLADIDEDADLVDPYAPSIRSFSLDGRRGSLPMAIPGAVQSSDAHTIRSREGSILTVRRPSRSWDDSSTHHSSISGEDPTVILPKSEPLSRADWLSVEAQIQAKQQQQQQQQQEVVAPDAYDGLDLQYILSRRSEGSIRSVSSRLSFVQGAAGPRRSSPHIFLAGGSSLTLPLDDTFMRLIQKTTDPRAFDALRYNWSFERERADASSSSSRRRQQVHQYRNDKSGNSTGPRVQEMWRCGHVGRFKVDRLVFKPQSTDSTKGTQQRIHIRHIPDPYAVSNTASGPHSVIHKHSRAVAFSIFRSHNLFSSRQVGGTGTGTGTGTGPPNTQTHMNMRSAIMLAPKKVQEQYTSTKTTRQLSTHGLLDNESRSGRRGAHTLSSRDRDSRDNRRRGQEREDRGKGKGKGKTSGKAKGKGKNDKKPQRANPTESTESSSAGSVANNAMISAPERPILRLQFSPSLSSSTAASQRDSTSRPVSPSSSLLPSIIDSANVPESETSSIPPTGHHRYHRDSLDSEDRLPTRTTHAEAFGALDPNDIENLRAKEANSRTHPDSGSKFAELLSRFLLRVTRPDDHQPRAFQPPWLITAGRDKQEENDRVLNDLNASFRDVGLLHTNPHKPSKVASKRKSSQGILDWIPDDSLYMLLPLWAGETDTSSIHPETSSAASFVTIPESRQYLLVWYVPFGETSPKNKKVEKKKTKQSHSSDSGVEVDSKAVSLPAFRVVAHVVTYDELRLTGVRVPSDGLAINGPEWEAINYPASVPPRDIQMTHIVVCQCHGRESGFHFLEDGLYKLGLCTREDFSIQEEELYLRDANAANDPPGKMILTSIGRAAVEMIWLGCLAITSFGSA